MNDSVEKIKIMKRNSEIIEKPKFTVLYVNERYRKFQTFQDIYRYGRTPKLNRFHKRKSCVSFEINHASQVATDLMIDYNIKITPQTVRNLIKKKQKLQ